MQFENIRGLNPNNDCNIRECLKNVDVIFLQKEMWQITLFSQSQNQKDSGRSIFWIFFFT